MDKRTLTFQFTVDSGADITVFFDADSGSREGTVGTQTIGSIQCLVVTKATAVIAEVPSYVRWVASTGSEDFDFNFPKNFAASPLAGGRLKVVFEQGNSIPVGLQWLAAPHTAKALDYECRFVEIALDVPRLVSLPKSIEIRLTSLTL